MLSYSYFTSGNVYQARIIGTKGVSLSIEQLYGICIHNPCIINHVIGNTGYITHVKCSKGTEVDRCSGGEIMGGSECNGICCGINDGNISRISSVNKVLLCLGQGNLRTVCFHIAFGNMDCNHCDLTA